MLTCRRMQIDPDLFHSTKLKFKWNKDLNINPPTLILIEEEVGHTLECIGTGDHLLIITSVAASVKAKDMVNKTKWLPTE